MRYMSDYMEASPLRYVDDFTEKYFKLLFNINGGTYNDYVQITKWNMMGCEDIVIPWVLQKFGREKATIIAPLIVDNFSKAMDKYREEKFK
jgi:hypothetical protein